MVIHEVCFTSKATDFLFMERMLNMTCVCRVCTCSGGSGTGFVQVWGPDTTEAGSTVTEICLMLPGEAWINVHGFLHCLSALLQPGAGNSYCF